MAQGLIYTIRARENHHQQEAARLQSALEDSQKQVKFFTNTHEAAPEGYIENNHCLPTFTIPIPGSDSLSNPAKWIKFVEDGKVAGYSEAQGPADLPTISEMYLSPSYNSTNPYEPMPCWFCHMLTGDTAHYYTLKEAVGKLDDWAHLAEISCYRKLEDDIVTAQGQINSLQADIKSWTQAKELSEGHLTGACTHGLVTLG